MLNSVLVYIPCHTDFHEALNQAQRLRRDFQSYIEFGNAKYERLHIVLSVNHFEPAKQDRIRAEKLFDEVFYYGEALLADVNVFEGFLVALRQNHEIFWILSANDELVEGSLATVLKEFDRQPDIQLLVANALGLSTIFIETQVLNPPKAGYWYGLISGVVYRTTNVQKYFNIAPFVSWTGWGHLAVIQSAIEGEKGLTVSTIPAEVLFIQGERDSTRDGHKYAHSFQGELILRFLFKQSKNQRRRLIREYILKNFLILHFYNKRDSKISGPLSLVSSDHYLSWSRVISESLIKSNNPLTYAVYKILKTIPFENGKNNKVLRLFKRFL